MYKVKVNGGKGVFDVDLSDKELSVNDSELSIDISSLAGGFSNVIYKDKSYNVEVVEINRDEKTCKIKVNGHLYAMNIEDKFDQLLQQLGMDSAVSNKVAEVKAPMPGMVLSLKVKEDDVVLKGDSLLILEAMKMENILKSPADGTVNKIMVQQGSKVEKNQVLLSFK